MILMGTMEKTLPCTRKMISTTMEKAVSRIITDMDMFTRGRHWEDRKARSAMSWNQMALTILDSRKKGKNQRMEEKEDGLNRKSFRYVNVLLAPGCMLVLCSLRGKGYGWESPNLQHVDGQGKWGGVAGEVLL